MGYEDYLVPLQFQYYIDYRQNHHHLDMLPPVNAERLDRQVLVYMFF